MKKFSLKELKCLSEKRVTNGYDAKEDVDELATILEKQLHVTEENKDNKESSTPRELLNYTVKENDILFNSSTGCKLLQVSIASSSKTTQGKRKPGQGKGKRKSRPKSPNNSNIIRADLLEGCGKFVAADSKTVYALDNVFKALQYGLENGLLDLKKINVVSLRRVLLMLMMIPIKQKEVQFNVIYWKNLIVIDYDWEIEESNKYSNERLRQLQYSGFKFEEVITRGDFETRYYSFVEQTINGIKLNYTAEIDAMLEEGCDSNGYVELKTHSKLLSPKNFQQKLLSTWCQNKLINCRHSLIGFRSNAFQLNSWKYYSSDELNNATNNAPLEICPGYSMNGSKSLKWFHKVITWISQQGESPNQPQVFKLKFSRLVDIFDSELQLVAIDEPHAGEIVRDTIPPWFQAYFVNNK